MRLTARLLSLLTTVVFSVSITAQVIDPMEVMQITPAEGTVESLQHFTITFGDLPVVVSAGAVPTLVKGGGATLEGQMRAGADGTSVLVDFDEESTASGQYYLNLPEASITVNGQRLLPLTLRFIIEGDIESFYEQITITPAEGEVTSLEFFKISLPQYVGDVSGDATVTNVMTQKTYAASMYSTGYDVLVYLSEVITDPGQYTLTVPAGAIEIYTLGEEVHELNFDYTIPGNPTGWFYDGITINPDEGVVESMQDFTLHFPATIDGIAEGSKATLTNITTGTTHEAAMNNDGNNVIISLAEAVCEPGRYKLTIPAGAIIVEALGEAVHELSYEYTISDGQMPSFTINPAEGEVYRLQYFTIAYGQHVVVDEDIHPVLVEDETGEAFECNLLEIGGNAVVYKEYPTSILGDYTLTIPANCIMIEATGQTNPEMVFHYTIVEKDTFVPTVIENQPDGDLVLYHRSGGVVREVEKEYTVEEGENPYEIVYEQQDGSLSIVFGEGNVVYIQRPVSWSYYDGWVVGFLEDDGKTITVPMGQYIAYTQSLEMAVQVGMFVYDDDQGTYVYDESIEEAYYTLNDDGTISLEGTNEYVILGTMNRAFGDQFQYLDYEWLQAGDYASVYIPADEQPVSPPDDLETEVYYMTTANFNSVEWEPYQAEVELGFDGDDVWLMGISKYLPEAWIHGTREGNTITFPNSQLLGSYEALLYFKCGELNLNDGTIKQKDMVLTFDGVDTYTTADYIFITTDRDNLYFVNYYQGMTLSKHLDQVIEVPEGLTTDEYIYTFTTSYDGNNEEGQTIVNIGFDGDDVYIQGLWDIMPEAWIKGRMVDGKLVIDLPQLLGDYEEEYLGVYPIYLIAFDDWTGSVLPQLTFDYDPTTRVFNNNSSAYGMGINKTGYLNFQDFYEGAFVPVNTPSGLNTIEVDKNLETEYYDLQGRRINDISSATGIIITRNADGTVSKMLKK